MKCAIKATEECRGGLLLLCHLQLDMQIAELPGLDGSRGIGHEIGAFGRLGKCDDVSDAGCSTQDRDETVKPERNTAVGRGAITERFEHVAEAQLGFVWRNLEDLLEDRFLDVRLMDTD